MHGFSETWTLVDDERFGSFWNQDGNGLRCSSERLNIKLQLQWDGCKFCVASYRLLDDRSILSCCRASAELQETRRNGWAGISLHLTEVCKTVSWQRTRKRGKVWDWQLLGQVWSNLCKIEGLPVDIAKRTNCLQKNTVNQQIFSRGCFLAVLYSRVSPAGEVCVSTHLPCQVLLSSFTGDLTISHITGKGTIFCAFPSSHCRKIERRTRRVLINLFTCLETFVACSFRDHLVLSATKPARGN